MHLTPNPLINEATFLRLGDTTSPLLARTGFATTDAGVLAFVGPSGQEASTPVLAGDFLVSLHVGVSPATKDSWWVWSEDREGLLLFLKAILGW